MGASLFGTSTVPLINVLGTFQEQSFTATAGQTLFTLTQYTYAPGTGSLLVFINGQKQSINRADYAETSSTSVTLAEACELGDFVDIIGLPTVTV